MNWNGKGYLDACLASLRAQSFHDFESILVDNGSQDGSVDFVRQDYPEVKIIALTENSGFCRANNIAIQDALVRGSKYFLLLNNDTYVERDFLSECLKVVESDPQIAAVCPKIYFASRPELIWYAGGDFSLWTSRAKHRGRKQRDRGQFDELSEISLATGCAMLVRAAAIHKVGLLDERFWAYVEDTDWSLRFRQRGYKLYFVPKARVWHSDGGSFVGKRSAEWRQYLSTRNMLLLGYKNARWYQLPSFLLGFLLTHVAFYTALRIVRRDYTACWAIYRGIGAFFKKLLDGSLHPSSRAEGTCGPRLSA